MADHFSPRNNEIIERLRNLKNADPDYPANLLKKRRTTFRFAVFAVTLPLVFAGVLKSLLGLLPHTSKAILYTILVSELAVATGLGAYVYRDQIKDWLAPEPTATKERLPSSTPSLTLTSSATFTPTETPTPTFTPTSTPTATKTIRFATSTPKPHPDDQGNHYGQTWTPRPPDN